MNAIQQSVSPVRHGQPRHGSPLSGASLRHLDYAAWHAHIAGHAGRPRITLVAPERLAAHARGASLVGAAHIGHEAA